MSAHICTGYMNCGFRVALARRAGTSIRMALLSGTMTQQMGADTGLLPDWALRQRAIILATSINVTLDKGLNMISVPLSPPAPMSAKSLAGLTGATTVITLDTASQRFVGWTPDAPDDGFPIEGGKGYIVNVPETRQFAYVGSQWTNQTEDTAAAPPHIRGADSRSVGVRCEWSFGRETSV